MLATFESDTGYIPFTVTVYVIDAMFATKMQIITDPHEILLFSLCIKLMIVVFEMTKQLSEENGGGPFCQQGNSQG